MFTIILAIIHAKYNGRFEGVFVATLVIDLAWIATFVYIFEQCYKG